MYNQECYFGYEIRTEEKEVEGIIAINGIIIRCTNPLCPSKYCKFNHFTGGLIPDSECEYYVEAYRRDKI